jgi:hypothetical protein
MFVLKANWKRKNELENVLALKSNRLIQQITYFYRINYGSFYLFFHEAVPQ